MVVRFCVWLLDVWRYVNLIIRQCLPVHVRKMYQTRCPIRPVSLQWKRKMTFVNFKSQQLLQVKTRFNHHLTSDVTVTQFLLRKRTYHRFMKIRPLQHLRWPLRQIISMMRHINFADPCGCLIKKTILQFTALPFLISKRKFWSRFSPKKNAVHLQLLWPRRLNWKSWNIAIYMRKFVIMDSQGLARGLLWQRKEIRFELAWLPEATKRILIHNLIPQLFPRQLGVGGAVRYLVVGTIGQRERPPRGQLWMEQCLTLLKYWPI